MLRPESEKPRRPIAALIGDLYGIRDSLTTEFRLVRCDCNRTTSLSPARCPRTKWGEHPQEFSPLGG